MSGLKKVPFHSYMPVDKFKEYKFPFVNAKTYESNLYHTRKVSDIVKMYLNEMPYWREYN